MVCRVDDKGFSSESSVLWISDRATVTLVGCSIQDNTVSGTKLNNAVISVNAVEPTSPDAQHQDTVLRLQQCVLTVNTADHVLIANRGGMVYSEHEAVIFNDAFSDVEVELNSIEGELLDLTHPLDKATASRPGIDATTPWLLTVQQVRHPIAVTYFATSVMCYRVAL